MKTVRSAAIALWLILAACLIIQAIQAIEAIRYTSHSIIYDWPYALLFSKDIIGSNYILSGEFEGWGNYPLFFVALALSTAYILAACALCLKSRKIALIGLCLPPAVYISILFDVPKMLEVGRPINFAHNGVVSILRFVALVALCLAIKQKDRGITLIISAASSAVVFLCGVDSISRYAPYWSSITGFGNTEARDYLFSNAWGLYVCTLLYHLILSAAYFLTGIACQAMPKAKRERRVTPRAPAARIDKLKELLDTGVITQEEFDTKKEEILKSDH